MSYFLYQKSLLTKNSDIVADRNTRVGITNKRINFDKSRY